MNYWNNPTYNPYARPQDYYTQPVMPYNRQPTVQGKVVDNMDVVKATDIPLDGSISYFPLADGTAIISRQLQSDGTSRMIVYKPMNTEETKYATEKDIKNIRQELESLKRQLSVKKVETDESI